MKIALVGYGKMGKAIEEIAKERGHEVVAVFDAPLDEHSQFNGADVAIEFSIPTGAVNNIQICHQNSVPVVVGTTGWYDAFPDVKEKTIASGNALLTATNFSIGVNLFFALNRKLAEMMNDQNDYEVSMEEIHHMQKLDHPSGTAITLAEDILHRLDRKNNFVGQLSDENLPVTDVDLNIVSYREPEVPGTHTIKYESDIDSITITHEAKSRKGFATGSVVAAEWLVGKSGVFTMKDVLNLNE